MVDGLSSEILQVPVLGDVVAPRIPQRQNHLGEFVGPTVPFLPRRWFAAAEVPRDGRVHRGDDVPAGSAVGDVVERQNRPSQRVRRRVGRRRRRDETDVLGLPGERRQHCQRIQVREAAPAGRNALRVGEEHRVEPRLLGESSRADEVVDVDERMRRARPLQSARDEIGGEAQVPAHAPWNGSPETASDCRPSTPTGTSPSSVTR